MTTTEGPTAPLTPGELFRALRERRGFDSTRKAAAQAGLSHTAIGNIEKAPGPVTMTNTTARRLGRLYGVPVEFVDKMARGAIDELPDDLDALRSGASSKQETRGRIHPVRFLGSVSAGITGSGVAGPVDYLGVADYFLGTYNPDDLYLLEVTGDSMVGEDVRSYVPPGSIIIVHEKLEPQPGQVIVAWLEHEDMGVLKVFAEGDDGDSWLLSYNAQHAPIHVGEENPAVFRGVMVANWTRAPGFR